MTTIREPFGAGPGDTTVNVGVAGTSCTAAEYGDGTHHRTVITITNLTMITPVGATNLASGKLIYTLPDGAIVTKAEYINIALTCADAICTTDTPVLGLGTTIGTGAVAVLSGTAGFVNMMAGQAVADCNGTAKIKTVNTQLVIEAADPSIVHLNIADGWAGADTIKANGTVVIEWSFLK